MRLILASTSPRRKELLALLGFPFEVVAPAFDETVRKGLAPEEQARSFALGKARSCAAQFPHDVILGSDTLISIDDEILGKPADARDAASMLRRLSGRLHLIHTSVALVRPAGGVEEVGLETVRVRMKPLGDGEIETYVRTGEGSGKAGAYSIQGVGGGLIDGIEGDYTAAVGLPLRLVADFLRTHGVPLSVDIAHLYQTKPFSNWAHFA